MSARNDIPPHERATYRRPRAVRLEAEAYGGKPTHVVLRALKGCPSAPPNVATMVTTALEQSCSAQQVALYGYCLMPDHLHALVEFSDALETYRNWLRDFKSYTTRQHRALNGTTRLWQRAGFDHVCRRTETAETVLAYIVENPVRAELVDRWEAWPWTRVFIDV